MVTSEEGQHVAEAIQALGYVECSAKTREGLNEVFDFAVRKVLELKNPPVQSSGCCIVLQISYCIFFLFVGKKQVNI